MTGAHDVESGDELCRCGHRLYEHQTVAVSADDVELYCGRCGCDLFEADR